MKIKKTRTRTRNVKREEVEVEASPDELLAGLRWLAGVVHDPTNGRAWKTKVLTQAGLLPRR